MANDYAPVLIERCVKALDELESHLEEILPITYMNDNEFENEEHIKACNERIQYALEILAKVQYESEDMYTFVEQPHSKIADLIRGKLNKGKSATALLTDAISGVDHAAEELNKYTVYITKEMMLELSQEAISIEHKRIISRSIKMIQDEIRQPLQQFVEMFDK